MPRSCTRAAKGPMVQTKPARAAAETQHAAAGGVEARPGCSIRRLSQPRNLYAWIMKRVRPSGAQAWKVGLFGDRAHHVEPSLQACSCRRNQREREQASCCRWKGGWGAIVLLQTFPAPCRSKPPGPHLSIAATRPQRDALGAAEGPRPRVSTIEPRAGAAGCLLAAKTEPALPSKSCLNWQVYVRPRACIGARSLRRKIDR